MDLGNIKTIKTGFHPTGSLDGKQNYKKLLRIERDGSVVERIFLDVPDTELIRRDPKGLYKKLKKGKLNNFFGFNIKPEFPKKPYAHISWEKNDTVNITFKKLCKKLKL